MLAPAPEQRRWSSFALACAAPVLISPIAPLPTAERLGSEQRPPAISRTPVGAAPFTKAPFYSIVGRWMGGPAPGGSKAPAGALAVEAGAPGGPPDSAFCIGSDVQDNKGAAGAPEQPGGGRQGWLAALAAKAWRPTQQGAQELLGGCPAKYMDISTRLPVAKGWLWEKPAHAGAVLLLRTPSRACLLDCLSCLSRSLSSPHKVHCPACPYSLAHSRYDAGWMLQRLEWMWHL